MPRDHELPFVGGQTMEDTLDNFERRCKVYLKDEQEKLASNNGLVAVLCDAVRLSREYNHWAERRIEGERDDPAAQDSPQTLRLKSMRDEVGEMYFKIHAQTRLKQNVIRFLCLLEETVTKENRT